jgi:hypothetical protein
MERLETYVYVKVNVRTCYETNINISLRGAALPSNCYGPIWISGNANSSLYIWYYGVFAPCKKTVEPQKQPLLSNTRMQQ